MEELLKKYIEENNIKGYLNWKLDSKNMKKILEKNHVLENDETLDDETYSIIQEYNYKLAMETGDIKEIASYIYGCDFDIEINKDGKIDLIDLQGAYLGGLDTYENFDTIMSASERLEGCFYSDYYGLELY